jgi:hypothetical protein
VCVCVGLWIYSHSTCGGSHVMFDLSFGFSFFPLYDVIIGHIIGGSKGTKSKVSMFIGLLYYSIYCRYVCIQ